MQPRLGVSYAVPGSGTVLRASYGRTHGDAVQREPAALERRGRRAICSATAQPLQPGKRNQVEVGVQQALGRWVVVDVGYFNKRTDNAYDFGVLFDTPIVFPISWDHSKIDGFTGRINLVEHRGFSAFMVLATPTRSSRRRATAGSCWIAGEATSASTTIRSSSRRPTCSTCSTSRTAPGRRSAGATIRVWSPDRCRTIDDALSLTADQQAAIGLFCGSTVATLDAPITSCASGGGATRIRIPADGTADDVNNPPRIAPRHLFDLGFGVDNLFHSDRPRSACASASSI